MTEISSHTENITDATSAGIEGAKGNKLNMIDIKKLEDCLRQLS